MHDSRNSGIVSDTSAALALSANMLDNRHTAAMVAFCNDAVLITGGLRIINGNRCLKSCELFAQ